MKFETPIIQKGSTKKQRIKDGPRVAIAPPNYEERGYIISAKIPENKEEEKPIKKIKPINNNPSYKKKRTRLRSSEINQAINHEPIIIPETYVTTRTYSKDRDEDGYLKIKFR